MTADLHGNDNTSESSPQSTARLPIQNMLRPCINFVKGKTMPEKACSECQPACTGVKDLATNSCTTYGESSAGSKSDPGGKPRPRGTTISPVCMCEDAAVQAEPGIKHKTVQKHKRKSRKSTAFALTDDESEQIDKSTNVPSTPSIRTYYITTTQKSNVLDVLQQKKYESESDNELPYLIDVASLPRFECPDAVCSSKKFHADDIDCKLLDGADQYNSIKEALLTIDVHSILESFKPAKCCQKVVLNGRNRSHYPYPASLQSLPLSEEDLDKILEIIQSNQKRFDTVKRLYESTLHFQRGTDAAHDQVYFFELFRKAEVKVSTATASSSLTSTGSSSTTRHDLKIFEFLRRIYSSHPIVDKAMSKRKKNATKTLYRHKQHHKKRQQRSKHKSKKTKHVTSSSSGVPSKGSSLTIDNGKQPMRNISFLLIPKSELSNFCGEMNSMYSPSLSSLPCDDVNTSSNPCMQDLTGEDLEEALLSPTEYAKSLASIYEQDETERPPRVKANSMGSVQSCLPTNNKVFNFEIMTCTVSSSATDQSKEELKVTSSSSSNTIIPDIALTRKSIDSDLSVRKHLFSSSSIITDNCGGKTMSCLPMNCSLRDNKSSFLNFPNLIPDAKRFLHRQKEEFFKPNLDKIVENSSETNSAISSKTSRVKVKSHHRDSSCTLTTNCSMESTSSSNQKIKFKVVKSKPKPTALRSMNNYDLPIAFEFVQSNDLKGKHMKIDKAVVAYAINPRSEFTFLADDGSKPSQTKCFKSENICVWPVFQQRNTKKKNNAFAVAIHSSAVRINNTGPVSSHHSGAQPNVVHGDFCDLGQKCNLTTDNFPIGYIGDDGKKSQSRKEKKDKVVDERTDKFEKEHKKDKDKANKLEKTCSRKETSSNVKIRKGARKKSSRKIVPELINIKIPTTVKATRLKHKFCQDGDRPGYVTVLRTPCNCPDVTIFIPCYCQQCEGKATKDGRPKSESDYAMVPIIEHEDAQSI